MNELDKAFVAADAIDSMLIDSRQRVAALEQRVAVLEAMITKHIAVNEASLMPLPTPPKSDK